jgi:exosortase
VPLRKDTLVWSAIGVCAAALIYQWARIWSLFPELRWGWALPFLVAWMLRERWKDRPSSRPGFRTGTQRVAAIAVVSILLLAFPFLRLIIEPFPAWPTFAWLFSITLVTLILALIAASKGAAQAGHFGFPIAFGLTALPWPTFLAVTAMGRLRIQLASIVAELIDLSGKPALATGTVIRMGAGSVGIEEACGGIRSLQAAVMLALALGEIRRLTWKRRLICVGAAIGLGILGNTIRMGLLASICAFRGQEGVHDWHDFMGAGELAFVFTSVSWFVLRQKWTSNESGTEYEPISRAEVPHAMEPAGPFRTRVLAGAVLAVVLLSEAATQVWYWRGEVRGRLASPWNAQLPRDLASYREIPFTESMQSILACSSHQIGQWKDASGADRAGYIVEWDSGQIAQYILLGHNPDICLTLGGKLFVQANLPVTVHVGRSDLPFESRTYSSEGKQYYVYFIAWNMSAGTALSTDAHASHLPTSWFRRQWREVAGARRNLRAQIIAVAIYSAPSPSAAAASFRNEIAQILR